MPVSIRRVSLHPDGLLMHLSDGTEVILAVHEDQRPGCMMTFLALMAGLQRHPPPQPTRH